MTVVMMMMMVVVTVRWVRAETGIEDLDKAREGGWVKGVETGVTAE